MWNRLLDPILQGMPGAVVLVVAYLVNVLPINARLDQLTGVMNREIIPLINELKKERVPGPAIQSIAERMKALQGGIADLKSDIQGLRASIESAKRFAALVSRLGPGFPAISKRIFKKGDVIPAAAWAKGPHFFKVTDPHSLNKVGGELEKILGLSGVKIIRRPEDLKDIMK